MQRLKKTRQNRVGWAAFVARSDKAALKQLTLRLKGNQTKTHDFQSLKATSKSVGFFKRLDGWKNRALA